MGSREERPELYNIAMAIVSICLLCKVLFRPAALVKVMSLIWLNYGPHSHIIECLGKVAPHIKNDSSPCSLAKEGLVLQWASSLGQAGNNGPPVPFSRPHTLSQKA